MISRRKILSRSLDNLDTISPAEEEEDVWYDKNKLCKDHIQEVLAKWTQIDDEIWAKIVVFERNRRVAKAYARSPIITINGSKHGFDGMRLGLNGFDNPMRDLSINETKKQIGDGFKMKMDDTGSILVKRYGKSDVYVHKGLQNPNEETVIGADVLKLPNQVLEIGKSAKLFDMKKFSININREFSRSYPDRSRLERQCLSAISLVKHNDNILNCPIWILVINVVAIDMLKSKMMAFPKAFSTENRSPVPSSEDPYSTIDGQAELLDVQPQYISQPMNKTSNNLLSLKNENEISPIKQKSNSKTIVRQDKQDVPQPLHVIKERETIKHNRSQHNQQLQQQQRNQQREKQDDPYYCGLLARIPNFIKSPSKSSKKKEQQTRMTNHHHNHHQEHYHNQYHRKISAQHISHPIAAFHQHVHPGHYPYKFYPHNHPLSQSQFSLWDSRSMLGGID